MHIRAQRIQWLGHLNRLEDIKLVKITERNPRGVKRKDDQRIDGKMKQWYEEAKTKKLGPTHQKQNSLERSTATDQNPFRVVVTEGETAAHTQ